MIATLFLALAAALAEIILWWAASAGRLTLVTALSLHALLSAVLALNIFTLARERSGVLLLAAGNLFMGPFGAVGGVAMALFASGRSSTDFQAYRRALGPDGGEPFSMHVHLAAKPGRTLLSFQDVMRWGSRTEKQAALRRMAERYSPSFAGALKHAMRDVTPEIRSEAGAAAQSILKTLEARAKNAAAQAAAFSASRDPTKAGVALAAYADAERAVAQSGLAAAERAEEAFDAALAAYAEARERLPGSARLRLKAAEALFEHGALAEAARESGAALAEDDPTGRALSIHLETLFALGRYGDIRRLMASHQGEGAARRPAAMWRLPTPTPAAGAFGARRHG